MLLIKIGGGDSINIRGIISDIASLGEPCVVVHGANQLRDRLAQQLGVEKEIVTSLSGYTSVLSDDRLMDLMMMAYAGLRNKQIVEMFQMAGVNAVGLSGLDGRLVQGKRNRGIKTRKNGKNMILRDRSGKPVDINVELLKLLLDNHYLPVITVPIVDENGVAINSENDEVLVALERVLGAFRVIQFIEAPGLLEDKDDPTSLVQTLASGELESREQQVEGRMRRKLHALRKLFEAGAKEVVIADGRGESPLMDAQAGKGTVIQ